MQQFKIVIGIFVSLYAFATYAGEYPRPPNYYFCEVKDQNSKPYYKVRINRIPGQRAQANIYVRDDEGFKEVGVFTDLAYKHRPVQTFDGWIHYDVYFSPDFEITFRRGTAIAHLYVENVKGLKIEGLHLECKN